MTKKDLTSVSFDPENMIITSIWPFHSVEDLKSDVNWMKGKEIIRAGYVNGDLFLLLEDHGGIDHINPDHYLVRIMDNDCTCSNAQMHVTFVDDYVVSVLIDFFDTKAEHN